MDKTKVLRLRINVSDEYLGDEGLDYAIVELTPQLIQRIKQLNDGVKSLKVYSIEDWDTPDFQTEDGDEPNTNVECCTLRVTDDTFFWTGMIKHTSTHWETEEVSIKELS